MSLPRLALLALLALGACVSQRVETRDALEPGADFTLLSSYDWGNGTSGLDALTLERVRRAVEVALAAKGWVRDPRDPDVRLVVSSSRWQTAVDTGFAGGERSADGNVDVEAGLLVLEAYDRGGAPLWRGTARGAQPANPTVEEREWRVRTAVEGMLRGFPPAGGGPR
jgi:hypothetical protein